MNPSILPYPAVIILSLLLLSGCGPQNKALNLADWERVYVPVDPATLMNTGPSDPSEVGRVPANASDIEPVFVFEQASFNDGSGPAAVIYSAEEVIPPNTAYMEMRVWQAYEAVLADEKAAGIYVNYGSSQFSPYTVSRAEMEGSLEDLPRQEKLPFNVKMRFAQ